MAARQFAFIRCLHVHHYVLPPRRLRLDFLDLEHFPT
jgi:hypothetical protein